MELVAAVLGSGNGFLPTAFTFGINARMKSMKKRDVLCDSVLCVCVKIYRDSISLRDVRLFGHFVGMPERRMLKDTKEVELINRQFTDVFFGFVVKSQLLERSINLFVKIG